MNGRFQPSFLEQYPHMGFEDVRLWEAYLQQFADLWDSFDYDVRIGTGRKPPDFAPEHLQRMVIENSKFRIDAVGYQGDNARIFEVKPDTSISAYGQFRVYTTLWQRDFPNLNLLGFTMITERVHPDIREMMIAEGVDIVEVEPLPLDIETGEIIPFPEDLPPDEEL